jgi:hypothetical protein
MVCIKRRCGREEKNNRLEQIFLHVPDSEAEHQEHGYRERWMAEKGRGREQQTVDRDKVKFMHVQL